MVKCPTCGGPLWRRNDVFRTPGGCRLCWLARSREGYADDAYAYDDARSWHDGYYDRADARDDAWRRWRGREDEANACDPPFRLVSVAVSVAVSLAPDVDPEGGFNIALSYWLGTKEATTLRYSTPDGLKLSEERFTCRVRPTLLG